jgi:hypothetical protein
LPDQDWPLRVTQVYRRDGSDWLLVNRHANPLARAVGLKQGGRPLPRLTVRRTRSP